MFDAISRPRIYFDNKQICNACNYKSKRKKLTLKLEKELKNILNKFRSKRRT